MKNKFEHLLLSLLLGISVLLGLVFWLNTIFGFNLFCKEHWAELAKLQAENIPISSGFYISIGIAIFIFVFGLCFIYVPVLRNAYKNVHADKKTTQSVKPVPATANIPQPTQPTQPMADTPSESVSTPESQPTSFMPLSRPPRLNLPKNISHIISQQQQNPKPSDLREQYNKTLSQIFSEAGYTVKNAPVFRNDFTPNLFAIAPNEIVWMGVVDLATDKIQNAVDKLQSVFKETLDSITVHINAFVVDTKNQIQPSGDIHVFKSMDELKTFISQAPHILPENMDDETRENFDAYSEYIDTMIQYIKTIG